MTRHSKLAPTCFQMSARLHDSEVIVRLVTCIRGDSFSSDTYARGLRTDTKQGVR
jgi:hypothetical protein